MSLTPAFQLEKRRKPLRILSTSDWHLGNGRIPAATICNRLRMVLFPKIAEIDLLNLGGDIWDTLLSMSEEVNVMIALLIDLLRLCDQHQVVVRVLLGTYSHDRGQSAVFPVYHEKCGFSNDLLYVNTVSLEEIASLGVRILYLPDDLPYESSYDCLEVVFALMTARGWTYVDYVFGHGYFEHMIASHIPRKPKCLFQVSQFTPFVRRYVCMGHIHQSDFTENVFYNNSFDRMTHGDESPKGFVMITDYGDTAKLDFVENTTATKFITFDYSAYTNIEEVGALYLRALATTFSKSEPGFVRVIHPSAELRQALQRLTTAQYTNLKYSAKRSQDEKIRDSSQTHRRLLDVKTYPVPNRDTLPVMTYDFLAQFGKVKLSLGRITEILDEV